MAGLFSPPFRFGMGEFPVKRNSPSLKRKRVTDMHVILRERSDRRISSLYDGED